VGDSPNCVADNLDCAAAWLGLESANLCWARQVHDNNVIEICPDTSPQEVRSTPADALISSYDKIACCVRTADCVPILVADPRDGRVAAIHAGWRGVVAGVVSCTIERLSRLGSEAERLLVAIGPHIRVSAFEVSEDVARMIAEVTPNRSVIHRDFGPRPHVALVESIREQLRVAGVPASKVDDVGGCTFDDANLFFSYRRLGRASGRHLHAIVPRSLT
jgi:polyphenol oxidase